MNRTIWKLFKADMLLLALFTLLTALTAAVLLIPYLLNPTADTLVNKVFLFSFWSSLIAGLTGYLVAAFVLYLKERSSRKRSKLRFVDFLIVIPLTVLLTLILQLADIYSYFEERKERHVKTS